MGLEGLFAPTHILVILVIVILIFGTKKLRGAGEDLGAAVRNFRKAMQGDDDPTPKETDKAPEEPKKLGETATTETREAAPAADAQPHEKP